MEIEPILEIQHVVRDPERMGDVARVVDRVERAARAVGHRIAVAEKLHGGSDHLVALLDETRRRDRTIHATRHGDQHAITHDRASRQLPHLGDDTGHDLRGAVDVGFGALVAQAEPHRAERELARHANSEQNVRRLHRTGGAGGAARGGDSGHVEVHEQRFAVGTRHRDIQHVRSALARLPETTRSGNTRLEALGQAIPQSAEPTRVGLLSGRRELRRATSATAPATFSVPGRIPCCCPPP